MDISLTACPTGKIICYVYLLVTQLIVIKGIVRLTLTLTPTLTLYECKASLTSDFNPN